uniref:Uncharacterized protein n=1 Tax=Cucumis melo TaxID=3656 RepID=A0A9I9EHM9_CUCME
MQNQSRTLTLLLPSHDSKLYRADFANDLVNMKKDENKMNPPTALHTPHFPLPPDCQKAYKI